MLVAWAAVAHASGSGWVQAIGALVAGLTVVGMCWPAFSFRRAEVAFVEAPADARSREALVVVAASRSALRLTPLLPPGPTTALPRGGRAGISLVPPYRGVLSAVQVRLSSAAPFGFLWWSVELELPLPSPVLIAPVASTASRSAEGGHSTQALEGRRFATPAGDIHQVRPYQVGDSRRHVHWRATAHTGTLMVRDSERPGAREGVVEADLEGDPVTTEHRASAALGAVTDRLVAGERVILVTVEKGERVSRAVPDARSAGRRLARAGTNPYDDRQALLAGTSQGRPR